MWIEVCAADDIEEEDVVRFDHGGRTFAVYRSSDSAYFATEACARMSTRTSPTGWCLVTRSSVRSTTAASTIPPAPPCARRLVDLATYPVKVVGGKILIEID